MKIGNNKYKSLAKDIMIFAIGNFGTKIIAFLCVSLYTAYLTTAEYGRADILNESVHLLLPVLSLTISEAVLRFMYDKDVSQSEVFGVGIRFVLLSSLIALIGVNILGLFVGDIQSFKWYFVAIFTLSGIEGLFGNITKGMGMSSVFAAKGIVHSAVFVLSNIVFLTVFNMGLDGYFISYILAYLITSIYMLFRAGIYRLNCFKRPERRLRKDMLKYSVPFIPATISWWINGSLDKYMILWLVGAEANGLYGVAQKVPTIITMVTGIFTQAWQLSAMQNYEDDDFGQFFSEIFRFVCTLIILGMSIILLLNKVLATFLFKNDFYNAWKYVPMLTLAAVLSTVAGFLASAFTSAKKTDVLFVSTMAGAIVNLVINYFLISWLGAFGAAVATVISFFSVIVIRLVTIKRFVKLEVKYFKLSVTLLLVFVASILVPWFDNYYALMLVTVLSITVINLKEIIDSIRDIYNKFR